MSYFGFRPPVQKSKNATTITSYPVYGRLHSILPCDPQLGFSYVINIETKSNIPGKTKIVSQGTNSYVALNYLLRGLFLCGEKVLLGCMDGNQYGMGGGTLSLVGAGGWAVVVA